MQFWVLLLSLALLITPVRTATPAIYTSTSAEQPGEQPIEQTDEQTEEQTEEQLWEWPFESADLATDTSLDEFFSLPGMTQQRVNSYLKFHPFGKSIPGISLETLLRRFGPPNSLEKSRSPAAAGQPSRFLVKFPGLEAAGSGNRLDMLRVTSADFDVHRGFRVGTPVEEVIRFAAAAPSVTVLEEEVILNSDQSDREITFRYSRGLITEITWLDQLQGEQSEEA